MNVRLLNFHLYIYLTRRGIRHAFNARCDSLYAQVNGIRIYSHLFKIRCSMDATMDLPNSCNRLKCYYFDGDVRGFNSITSSTIILLNMPQRRAQCIFRYGRQGIRTITRTSRTTYFVTNISIRRSNRVDQLIDCSTCQTSTRTYGASGGILNGILRRLGRVTSVSCSFSSLLRIVQCIKINESGTIR